MKLLRVLFEPEKVFVEVKESTGRAWVLPLVATLVLAVISSVAITNLIGLETIMRNQMMSQERTVQALGQEKIDERAHEMANSPVWKTFSYGGAAIIIPIAMLIGAGVIFGLAQMMGAATSFGKVFSVYAYSSFAYSLVTTVMSILVVLISADRSALDTQALVKTNLSIVLDKATTAKPLYSIAGSLDLLTFWLIFLIALGLTKISARTSMGKALIIVAVPWVVWVLVKAGFSALF